MGESIEIINKNKDRLQSTSANIEKLGNAFYTIGNRKLGNELLYYAGQIEEGIIQIDKALNKIINEQFNQVQINSATVLKGVLADLSLEKNKKE